jgi:hypothetical protein
MCTINVNLYENLIALKNEIFGKRVLQIVCVRIGTGAGLHRVLIRILCDCPTTNGSKLKPLSSASL